MWNQPSSQSSEFSVVLQNSHTDFEFAFMSKGKTRTVININYNSHNFTVPELLAIPSVCRNQATQFLAQILFLISFAAE